MVVKHSYCRVIDLATVVPSWIARFSSLLPWALAKIHALPRVDSRYLSPQTFIVVPIDAAILAGHKACVCALTHIAQALSLLT